MIASTLLRALRSLFTPTILFAVTLPFVAALLVWSGLLLVYWDTWSRALAVSLHLDRAEAALAAWHLHWLASGSNALLLLALVAVATLLTALLVIATIAMPVMVRVVSQQDYPELLPARGGTTWGSITNALSAFLTYLPVWLISLPFWFLPPLGQILSLLATAWLNVRLFSYDALAEHATPEEYRVIMSRAGTRFFVLGLVVALLQWIPIVNLLAPTYAGLVFVHAGLAELRRVRAASYQAAPTTVVRARARS